MLVSLINMCVCVCVPTNVPFLYTLFLQNSCLSPFDLTRETLQAKTTNGHLLLNCMENLGIYCDVFLLLISCFCSYSSMKKNKKILCVYVC